MFLDEGVLRTCSISILYLEIRQHGCEYVNLINSTAVILLHNILAQITGKSTTFMYSKTIEKAIYARLEVPQKLSQNSGWHQHINTIHTTCLSGSF